MPFRRRKNTAAIPRTVPAFEHIVTEASESFLWRLDDYPWERNVWNFHPEYEIHLLRKS
ncbi:MAG: AraC family transcriptional regulator, partial [Mesorhizobium sp.]